MEKHRKILHKINLTAQILSLTIGVGFLLYDGVTYLHDKPIHEKFLECVFKTPSTWPDDISATLDGRTEQYTSECLGYVDFVGGYKESTKELEEIVKGNSDKKLTLTWIATEWRPDGLWRNNGENDWPDWDLLLFGTSSIGFAIFLFALEKWILWLLRE